MKTIHDIIVSTSPTHWAFLGVTLLALAPALIWTNTWRKRGVATRRVRRNVS